MPDEAPILTAIRSVAEAADPTLTTRVLADWFVDSTDYATAPLMPALVPAWLGDLSAATFPRRKESEGRKLLQILLGNNLPHYRLARLGLFRSPLGSVLLDGVLFLALDVRAQKRPKMPSAFIWPTDPAALLAEWAGTNRLLDGKPRPPTCPGTVALYHPFDTGTVRGWRLLLAPPKRTPLSVMPTPEQPADVSRVACPGCGVVRPMPWVFRALEDEDDVRDSVRMYDPWLSGCYSHPLRVIQSPRGRQPDALIRPSSVSGPD